MVVKTTQDMPTSLVPHDSLRKAWEFLHAVHKLHQRASGKRALLLYGGSGEGKTFTVKQYLSLFPTIKTAEVLKAPVFYCRLDESKKTPDDLLCILILALGQTPPKGKPRAGVLLHQFKTLVREKCIELFIIDEIQQVLPKTDGQRALEMLKFLCALIDAEDLQTSFVFVGSTRAMHLLAFGACENTVDDNEQLSRRMLRPVKLDRIEPRSPQWIRVTNYFVQKIGFRELLVPDDKELFDRIYLAYTERAFSTLEDLFLDEERPNYIEDTPQLLAYLSERFLLTSKRAINPFDTEQMDADEVDEAMQCVKQDYFKQLEAED